MKKIALLVLSVILIQIFSVCALDAGEAMRDWQDAKQVSREKQKIHNEAKIDFAADKSEDKREQVVETGKDVLNAALDEGEAWLIWKKLEAESNPDVPDEIRQSIIEDVGSNLAKIDSLRLEVDEIKNQIELGVVFLKMVGKYFELLSDVARNSGNMWAHIADIKADTIHDYEAKMRAATDSDVVSLELDLAIEELNTARDNIARAKASYEQVRLPGTPLLKFSEGNNYLNAAKSNLLLSNNHLIQAYGLMMRGE